MCRTLLLIACAMLAACGGEAIVDVSRAGGSDGGTESDADGPCTWDPDFDDAAPWGCTAARALVVCASCSCLSDGPISCPGCEDDSSCVSLCTSVEYALACGGIGPPPPDAGVVEPPTSCRSAGTVPAGIEHHCCPCE